MELPVLRILSRTEAASRPTAIGTVRPWLPEKSYLLQLFGANSFSTTFRSGLDYSAIILCRTSEKIIRIVRNVVSIDIAVNLVHNFSCSSAKVNL